MSKTWLFPSKFPKPPSPKDEKKNSDSGDTISASEEKDLPTTSVDWNWVPPDPMRHFKHFKSLHKASVAYLDPASVRGVKIQDAKQKLLKMKKSLDLDLFRKNLETQIPIDPSKPWHQIRAMEKKVELPVLEGCLSVADLEKHFLSILNNKEKSTEENFIIFLAFLKRVLANQYHFILAQLVAKRGLEEKTPKITPEGLATKGGEDIILRHLYDPRLNELWADLVEGKSIPHFTLSSVERIKIKDRDSRIHPLNQILGYYFGIHVEDIWECQYCLQAAEKLFHEPNQYIKILAYLREAFEYKQRQDDFGLNSREFLVWQQMIQEVETAFAEIDFRDSRTEEIFQTKMMTLYKKLKIEAKKLSNLYEQILQWGIQLGDSACIGNQCKNYLDNINELRYNPQDIQWANQFVTETLPRIAAKTEKQFPMGKLLVARLNLELALYFQYCAQESNEIKKSTQQSYAGQTSLFAVGSSDTANYFIRSLIHSEACAKGLKMINPNDPSLMLWNNRYCLGLFNRASSEDPEQVKVIFETLLAKYRGRCVNECLVPCLIKCKLTDSTEKARRMAIEKVFPSPEKSTFTSTYGFSSST